MVGATLELQPLNSQEVEAQEEILDPAAVKEDHSKHCRRPWETKARPVEAKVRGCLMVLQVLEAVEDSTNHLDHDQETKHCRPCLAR